MPELIDMLMHSADDDTPYFTVDKDLNFVTMTLPAEGLLKAANTLDIMQATDHFQILSIGCVLPLSFEFWENDNAGDFRGVNIEMNYKDLVGGPLTPIDPQAIWLPYSNYELNMGNFVKFNPLIVDTNFKLYMNFESTVGQKVSMVGVNEALDEMEFRCPLFMKILHTLPMTN